MKKALIITYYWPPSGGSGVQRWLKFVKYFRNFGIEPVVYTVKNPDYIIGDDSLEDDIPNDLLVLKQPIWEPNKILGKFKNNKNESAGFLNSKPSLIGRFLHFIRANFFIPDARKFWIRPSVNYLESYLKKNAVDVIISTGPPHSTHLIALELKKQLNTPWISDFRDPWTEIDYFHQLPLTKWARKMHFKMEESVLRKSDAVLVVSETMKKKYAKFNSQVLTITNGFDQIGDRPTMKTSKKFSLVHVGMMNADRNVPVLWKVLAETIKENSSFRNDLVVKLIGKVDATIHDFVDEYKLKSHVEFVNYIPHDQVIIEQLKAQVLLLVVNDVPSAKGILTGKLFEYLNSGRPILAIAPSDGDLANIMNDCNAGKVIDFEDEDQLKKSILEYYELFKKDELKSEAVNVDKYHRKSLTEEVSKLIIRMTR